MAQVTAHRHPALLLVALLAAALFALLASGARAAEERIGERLFLVRDKPGTSTHFHMIVNAGCADEVDGRCRGVAHYLEHLVLAGRNPGQEAPAVRIIADGSANGWTRQRATAYLHTVPPRANGPRADLETLFGFYAARLQDFHISDEEAARERNVVAQEHAWRVGSRPFLRFARKLERMVMPHLSEARTDVDAVTVENARAFHRNWYAINNVSFAVKGDVEPSALKEIAGRALAGLAPRTLPRRAAMRPPEMTCERTDIREEETTIKRPGVILIKLVRIEEPDAVAGRAARSVLISFLRSRLAGSPYDALVDREPLAAGLPGVSIERVAPRIYKLTINASAAPDVAPERLLAAIERYVQGLASAGIPEATITRLKNRYAQARASADQDPAQVYARLIGWIASRAPYGDLAKWPQHIAAVTPGDVELILKGLAGPGRIVTGILAPAAQP
jgi:zinc protease